MKRVFLFAFILISGCTKPNRVEKSDPPLSLESEIRQFIEKFDSEVYLVEKEFEAQIPRRFSDTCKLVPSRFTMQSPPHFENCHEYDSISSIYSEKLKLVFQKYWDNDRLKSVSLSLGQPAEKRITSIKSVYTCKDSSIKVLANSRPSGGSDYNFVMVMRGEYGNRRILNTNLAIGYSGADPFKDCELLSKRSGQQGRKI